MVMHGVVLRSMGRIDDARDAFTRALSYDPEFEPALFNLADIAIRQGNPDVATRHYRRVLEHIKTETEKVREQTQNLE